ncbi:MAG: hypothetical protein AAGD96_03000 [Chloroflexota bacterium]
MRAPIALLLSLMAIGLLTASLVSADDNEVAAEGETITVEVAFEGLEDLGADYLYEGWLIDDGNAVSAGRFSVDAQGKPSESEFRVDVSAIANVGKYVLTIEPVEGDDPAPSATHILAGDFDGENATLTLDDPAALGTDFSTAAGSYILAAPTGEDGTPYNYGIWFLDPSGPSASLDLPVLPEGWAYEGWVVGEDGPVSAGIFTDTAAADSDAGGPASGPNPAPPFPGQDFITPPADLVGQTAVISVEPSPDNSEAPFTLKPLVGEITDPGEGGVSQNLNNNAAATTPSGTATIKAFETVRINWQLTGLEDLGADYVYEGWLIDNGNAISAGRFSVNEAGEPSIAEFEAQVSAEENVSTFVLTIEPAEGDDPASAATHILAGDFVTEDNKNKAALSIGHGAALGSSFLSADGTFILAAPTGEDGTPYNYGIWFLDPSGPSASLDLPTLPEGWAYEGWVVGEGGPVSTGIFTDTAAADSDAGGPTAGPNPAPPFPGQDFITPPVDLVGQTAVISVEPVPDNSEAPFTLKPLVGEIADPGEGGISQDLNNNAAATSPSGTVYLNQSEYVRISWDFAGLEDLGEDYVYEGWLIDSKLGAISAGRFTVDADGNSSLPFFVAEVSAKENVGKFVLTIEPAVGDDPAPAATHVIAGDFANGTANATIDDEAALGNDFTSASGEYILAVPTDTGNVAAYYNGIWFLDPAGPSAGLDLPVLPEGWAYEGWVVGEDGPVSTGIFTDTAAADSDAGGPTAGPGTAPPFPGQDFVDPAVDLRGQTAVISIEPVPDNSPAPFTFKPLVHTIGDVEAPTTQSLENNIANTQITGTINLVNVEAFNVSVIFEGLEDLGDDYVYESWLIDNGTAVPAGRFSVDSSSRSASTTTIADFSAFVSSRDNVSTYVLTIEPVVGDDPRPSATHVVAGDFTNGVADVGISHAAALGNDFTGATGEYILGAPSGADTNAPYYNGIWFLVPGEPNTAGLDLPTLPDGWVYEGWIVTEDGPISTGTFTDPAAADSDAGGPDAGPGDTPAYPGQDFVDPALDLRGLTAVISIEPSPDNSPDPFTFKPLVDQIDDVGGPPATQMMTNNIENSTITGTIRLGFEERFFFPLIFTAE